MSTTQTLDPVKTNMAPLVGAIEQAKKGELVPAGLSPIRQTADTIAPIRPKWMKEQDDVAARTMADSLFKQVQENPADIRLLSVAQSLGGESERAMVPAIALYEKKVVGVLKQSQTGSPTNLTLLDVKRQMDLINPAVLRSKPLPVRWAIGFLTRVPKGDEVLKMIYENRATVMSTVNGLTENLRVDADNLEANLEDLALIYRGLLSGQQMLERDIYVGQMVIEKLKGYLVSMEAGPVRDNVTQFGANLTTQVIFLQDEENLNLQFFGGAQAVAQLTTAQIHLNKNLGRLLTRSVLANLGLNVAASELQASMEMTRQIKDAIGNTVKDTAGNLKNMGEKMIEARSQGGINLEALEAACQSMEDFFTRQAEANTLIIEKGGQTMRKLGDMSTRLRSRVEGGHDSMVSSVKESKAS